MSFFQAGMGLSGWWPVGVSSLGGGVGLGLFGLAGLDLVIIWSDCNILADDSGSAGKDVGSIGLTISV